MTYFLLNALYAGPDAQRNWREILDNGKRKVEHEGDEVNSTHQDSLVLDFFASELRLRGSAQVVQPHSNGGDILCWNGEVRVDKPFRSSIHTIYFEDI
jgi:asparagine synthetase B (glutamine-hydrolysing)